VPSKLPRPRIRARAGFALEATLAVLLLLIVLSAAAATTAVGAVRSTAVDESISRLNYAADAAADGVVSRTMSLVRTTGAPSQAQLDSLQVPNFAGTSLDGITVTKTVRAVAQSGFDTLRIGAFSGMVGEPRVFDTELVATDPAANRSELVVRTESFRIPAFQFGVFYDADLEINPAGTMTLLGRIHTNRNLYLCPSTRLNFLDRVTAAGSLFRQRKEIVSGFCGRLWFAKSDVSTVSPLPADLDTLGVDNRGAVTTTCCAPPAGHRAFRDSVQARAAGRVQTVAHAVDSLFLALGPGVPARQIIAPRSAADSPQLRSAMLAWTSDLVINVPAASVSTICDNLSDPAIWIRRAGLELPTRSDCQNIFDSRSFWDPREARNIRSLAIDVDELRLWIGTRAARRYTSIYVTFTGASTVNPTPSAPLGSGAVPTPPHLPAVRLRNASRLPGPLTIGSSHPVYVDGDFNYIRWLSESSQVWWQPAAIIADAVTFLSEDWRDSRATLPLSSRTVDVDVFVRAAIAAGHAPTYAMPDFATANADAYVRGASTNYGGGFENLPRLLETWTGRNLYFRGSMVSLWTTAYYSWFVRAGTPFTAPNRNWSFDTRFRRVDSLPPLTPMLTAPGQVTVRFAY
jgi:type II secretory pathway pseudopilin PulG